MAPALKRSRVDLAGPVQSGKRTISKVVWSGKRALAEETDVQRGKRTRVVRESQDRSAGTSADDSLITNYKLTEVLADGRCLFRSVARAWCLRRGMGAPDEAAERELADDLRSRVVDELIKQREFVSLFLEEGQDFDEYVEEMRNVKTWGSQRELAMLIHVVRLPIYVYNVHKKIDEGQKGTPLKLNSTYGDTEYIGRPIEILFLQAREHYQVLEIVWT